jgi:hypothetical protein
MRSDQASQAWRGWAIAPSVASVRSCIEGGVSSHRGSQYHRRIVRIDGAVASPPVTCARSWWMTRLGSSPRAKRCSALTRSPGQEYDPGCGRIGVGQRLTRPGCAVSAARRRAVMHPEAFHNAASSSANTSAAVLSFAALRCWRQSMSDTPCVRWYSATSPAPGPAHSAQHGSGPPHLAADANGASSPPVRPFGSSRFSSPRFSSPRFSSPRFSSLRFSSPLTIGR